MNKCPYCQQSLETQGHRQGCRYSGKSLQRIKTEEELEREAEIDARLAAAYSNTDLFSGKAAGTRDCIQGKYRLDWYNNRSEDFKQGYALAWSRANKILSNV